MGTLGPDCPEYIHVCMFSGCEAVKCRDFNYPHIDWSVPVNNGSICSSLFLTCVLENGLTQLVNSPTRGNHCIDLVMVSDVNILFDISVVDPFCYLLRSFMC